jgi:hypothetical protein
MALPAHASKAVTGLLVVGVLAWIIELFGLIFIQRSCSEHVLGPWAVPAQLPGNESCRNTYRFIWFAVLIELPIVIGLVGSLLGKQGTASNLNRYRLGWMSLLSVATVLQIWGANVALNLTDSIPKNFTSATEINRAWVTFIGFAVLSAVNIVLIFILGDDSGAHLGNSTTDSLLSGADTL